MYYKTEAIEILGLHIKIARRMKKLLMFNQLCVRDMSQNMDTVKTVIGPNCSKYEYSDRS